MGMVSQGSNQVASSLHENFMRNDGMGQGNILL